MNEVCDNYYVIDIINLNYLINATSDSKKFSFCICVKIVDGGLRSFYFLSFILFLFFFIFYFLFLEQHRLGVISHAVTSVTN